MELPSWLKIIESLIGNLNISGWFRGWFTKVNIEKIFILPVNIGEEPKIVDIPRQGIETGIQEEFTDEERYLIAKINKAHELCGCNGFDFEKNYRQALNHIRKKLSEDWYECAAKDMVLVKENIDFFSAFKEVDDPKEKESFEGYKKDINYLYDIIQKIKHSNKRGSIEEEFLSPYDKKFNNVVMTDERYQEIFDKFQKLLIELFKKFKLKDE